jgi:Ca-activated chloride channel family protein
MPAASMKDWLATNRTAPSWLLSLVLHAFLIWLLLIFSPVWYRYPVGNGDDPTRLVNIFMKDRGDGIDLGDGKAGGSPLGSGADDTGDEADASDGAPSSPSNDPLAAPQQAVPDTPGFESQLPKADQTPGAGPAASTGNGGLPNQNELINPGGSGSGRKGNGNGRGNGTGTGDGDGSGGGGGGGIPGASFMGIKDRGTRVVYVVDASSSMLHHNAMRGAKAALGASLQNLDAGQQFQVIFYNDTPYPMSLKGVQKKQLYFATDVNKNAARQFISGVEPDSGTQHLDAIKLGLSFGPEVMFVLTDSGEPTLSARELDEIQRKNGGRARIHCIEFGVGSELGNAFNFLKKLAQQNGGTYRYVDVTEFARK